MTRPHALALCAITVALTGCASSNEMIVAGISPSNGAPAYYRPSKSPEELRAEQLYDATLDGLQPLLRYAQINPDFAQEIKVEKVGLTTSVSYSTTAKALYPAGAYALHGIADRSRRHGLVFADLVASNARKILDRARELGGQVMIEATYAAQADSVPVRNIQYRGEYGSVLLIDAYTTLNGKAATVSIAKGQQIDNAQLAALRAVSLSGFVRGALKPYEVVEQFQLSTSDQRGPEHRSVKVTIKIAPAP